MAPIYLAARDSNVSKSGPNIFRERFIHGYRPATLTSQILVGLPARRQLTYDGYAANIDVFLFASSEQRVIWTNFEGYTGDFTARETIPLHHPRVLYVPSASLKSDDIKKLEARFKTAAETERKDVLFYVTKPSKAIRKVMAVSCKPLYEKAYTTVTPVGYECFLLALNIVSEFLGTHSYPAFRIEWAKETIEISTFTDLSGPFLAACIVVTEYSVHPKSV